MYYALRPHLIRALGEEPNYKSFSGIITKIENLNGCDLPGSYRDIRGTLYHPHTGEQIPLGTLNVERYRRPDWTFNKVLYCEKEGFFPILMEAKWPERFDCALLTAKRFASRAARDMIDLFGDAIGTFRSSASTTRMPPGRGSIRPFGGRPQPRPERKIEIINLGLGPWEAFDMGLEVEKVTRKSKTLATIADYVADPKWRAWLQGNRVELNAMSTPQFLHWLEKKFMPYAGKVMPHKEVLQERIVRQVRDQLRLEITNRVLTEADVDGQVEHAFRAREHAILDVLPAVEGTIERHLLKYPADLWADPVHHLAMTIAIEGGNL